MFNQKQIYSEKNLYEKRVQRRTSVSQKKEECGILIKGKLRINYSTDSKKIKKQNY